MNIYVLNDTSRQHAGCRATMNAIYNILKDHKIIGTHYVGMREIDVDAYKQADYVLVNGEGTMHSGCNNMRFLMKVLKDAKNDGKMASLINSVWQNNPDYTELFHDLDFVSFREPLSQQEAGFGEVYKDMAFHNDYIVYGKNKRLSVYKGDVFGGVNWHDALDDFDYKHVPLGTNFQEIITKMKSCKFYITGQYHGVIMAIISNTPFVAIQGNTHKIEGLIKAAGCKIPVCTEPKEVRKCIDNISLYVKEFDKLREYYLNAPKITPEVLGL